MSLIFSKYLELGTYNRRTFPRYDYRVGITVKPTDPKIRFWDSGISQNLSEDGISIMHSKVLIPNEPVWIRLPIFESEDNMILKGQVAWVAIDDLYGDSPYWVRAGIRFEDIDSYQRETLQGFISSRKTEQDPLAKRPAKKIDFVM